MKKHILLIASALAGIMCESLWAQNNSDLDLSTRCIGNPPPIKTVDSVTAALQTPNNVTVLVGVTNFYGNTNDYLDIYVNRQHLLFPGAGMDDMGNYISTNYPPLGIQLALRCEYNVRISCPNGGAHGSLLFRSGAGDSGSRSDFSAPEYFVNLLTASPADPVSSFLWNSFPSATQAELLNPGLNDAQIQTILIQAMNQIITSGSIYDSARFANVTLGDDTLNLLPQNPVGSDLVLLNRMLLRDAYSGYSSDFTLPTKDQSGTALIDFQIQPPQEYKLRKNRPADVYTVLVNRSTDSGGTVNLENPGTGGASTNDPIIEVIKDKYGHYGVGDGCDDATKAPGQQSWLTMGPGANEETNRVSLNWHVSLGRTFDGLAAGQISFRQPGLTPDSYTPFALYYEGSMTNLYGTEILLPDNMPFITTNSFCFIQTNAFVPAFTDTVCSAEGVTFTNSAVPVKILLDQYVCGTVTNYTTGWDIPDMIYTNVYVITLTNISGLLDLSSGMPDFSGWLADSCQTYFLYSGIWHTQTWSGALEYWNDIGEGQSVMCNWDITTDGQLPDYYMYRCYAYDPLAIDDYLYPRSDEPSLDYWIFSSYITPDNQLVFYCKDEAEYYDLLRQIGSRGAQVIDSGFVPRLTVPVYPDVNYGSTMIITTNCELVVRQVKSYQTFVDIQTPNTNETVLNFYFANRVGPERDYHGLYTNFPASGPFVTYTIANPDPTTTNNLNIIETRNGSSPDIS